MSDRERPRVNADDDRFFDFFYPRDPLHAYGVYERDMPARYVAAIEEIAARWSKTSSLVEEERWHGRHRDCQIADDWAAELRRDWTRITHLRSDRLPVSPRRHLPDRRTRGQGRSVARPLHGRSLVPRRQARRHEVGRVTDRGSDTVTEDQQMTSYVSRSTVSAWTSQTPTVTSPSTFSKPISMPPKGSPRL